MLRTNARCRGAALIGNSEIKFESEVALCAKFIAALKDDWIAYPETCGWDILLSRRADGFQIGIQAKLRLNAHVLNQTIEDGRIYSVDSAGPDCRAVLVPLGAAAGLSSIASHLGITVIQVSALSRWRLFEPDLPVEGHRYGSEDWFELCPTKRHQLPEYVPDVDAGASSPLQLTEWKIAALKIAVTLEKRGFVTRSDFKHHQIDHRRWIAPLNGWLRSENGVYVAGPNLPAFKTQHPRVYDEIAADIAEWMPLVPVPPLVSGRDLFGVSSARQVTPEHGQ